MVQQGDGGGENGEREQPKQMHDVHAQEALHKRKSWPPPMSSMVGWAEVRTAGDSTDGYSRAARDASPLPRKGVGS